MAVWTLRSGLDRRFRAGHPWVFSNELADRPKGLTPGDPVELRDASGGFVARGYGNPASLIAFRAVSRDPAEAEPCSASGILKKLRSALALRVQSGLGQVSHRLCFGEADGLPGLIIDRYRVPEAGQVFVVQAHTAGADRWVSILPEVLESLLKDFSKIPDSPTWEETAVLVRNDMGVRELEGLAIEEPRILKSWKAGSLGVRAIRLLAASSVRVSGAGSSIPRVNASEKESLGFLDLRVNLEQGQKTAFYLDQAANIRTLVSLLERAPEPPLKILDLCSYVGQWGSQIARSMRARGLKAEVTSVDASYPALDLAKNNIESAGGDTREIKADVIGGLGALGSGEYDLVIADPPALMKSRKNIPQARHAYLQLNTDAFRLVKNGGWVVSCSCSSLFEESEFVATLAKAARRSGVEVRWIAKGMPSPDHPVLAEFPEGDYLKCRIGRVTRIGDRGLVPDLQ